MKGMENAKEKNCLFVIEDDDATADAAAFVKFMSAIPSRSRKKRGRGVRLSHECGSVSLLDKFLENMCDFSGKLAGTALGMHGCKCRRR